MVLQQVRGGKQEKNAKPKPAMIQDFEEKTHGTLVKNKGEPQGSS